MTKTEAEKIPALQIHPNGLLEDCFFYKMAVAGKLSDEQGRKAQERLKAYQSDPILNAALTIADLMLENLDKYGVACVDWCE